MEAIQKKSTGKILVIGASGFVGRNAVKQLLSEGHAVRCLARNPQKVQHLAALGCETVQGDISSASSLLEATTGVEAVYISIQTLVSQHTDTAGQDFMDIELKGLQLVIDACHRNGVRRIIYVTFLGVSLTAKSEWIIGRWKAEQLLLNSDLDVTVIRPGMIVGRGGQGFDMLLGNAAKRIAIVVGSGNFRFRTIAISDLAFILAAVLNNKECYGKAFDIGSKDVFTMNQMIDIAAETLGKKPPAKIHIPTGVIRTFANLIGRIGKMPAGAMKGMIDSVENEMIGDPAPLNKILSREMLNFRQSVQKALTNT